MNIDPTPRPELRANADGALVVCAAWLLTGFIGATAVAAGLLQLFDRGAKPLAAVILALCGGALALTGWIHAHAFLDRVEHASVDRAKRANAMVAGASAESTGATR